MDVKEIPMKVRKNNLNEEYRREELKNLLIGSKISKKKDAEEDIRDKDKLDELKEWINKGGVIMEAVRSTMNKDFSNIALGKALHSMYGRQQHKGMGGRLTVKGNLPKGRFRNKNFRPENNRSI